jgi:hypothetical protein
MKKTIYHLTAVLLLVMIGTVSAEQVNVDAVSSATPGGTGWKISLLGVRNDELWQSEFESWKKEPEYQIQMELERKGETKLYEGILLKEIIAIVDDASGGMPYEFQTKLWEEGYEITLTATDGYSASFSTKETSALEIMLVDSINGESVTPQIAGNITGKAWVRNLSEIELSLAPVDLGNNSFEFLLDINGSEKKYTIKQLENMPIYIEDRGGFTNSYGNTTEGIYGGVKLIPLISEFMELTTESSIKIIAMDGYEMTYGGEMLLDQKDGEWILAFKENGEYMPEDPGYIRLVKVGPGVPNITGHISARMIKKIRSEGEPFRNFELKIIEKDINEVFDRQTLQSGVITNKNRVVYFDRKSSLDIPYMGISIWRLLERLKGYSSVKIEASDGFSVTLDNSELEGNDGVILAMYTGSDDLLLEEKEWPLRLVWDKNAETIPAGIKAIRNVVSITLIY